ncbi:hypothetical protein AAB008_004940 [Escherichia coli]
MRHLTLKVTTPKMTFNSTMRFNVSPGCLFQYVTNGAIVIHTQRLKSDPGGNLLS